MKRVFLFCMLGVLAHGARSQELQMRPPDGVKLEVVSVRHMSAEEAAQRSPSDVIGLDVVVRLRLSCSTSGVYILTTSNPVHLVPEGHAVKITQKGVVWRYGTAAGGEATLSPGSGRFCGEMACEWVRLPAHSALEWEKLDVSAETEEVRAFTVFTKDGAQGTEREITSTSFNAPVRVRAMKTKN